MNEYTHVNNYLYNSKVKHQPVLEFIVEYFTTSSPLQEPISYHFSAHIAKIGIR